MPGNSNDISNLRFAIAICISIAIAALGLYLWMLILTPRCSASGYCTPVQCISSAGCISPCVCAKQQGDGYGVCVGTGNE